MPTIHSAVVSAEGNENQEGLETPRRSRSAFTKRENARLFREIEAQVSSDASEPSISESGEGPVADSPKPILVTRGTQTDQLYSDKPQEIKQRDMCLQVDEDSAPGPSKRKKSPLKRSSHGDTCIDESVDDDDDDNDDDSDEYVVAGDDENSDTDMYDPSQDTAYYDSDSDNDTTDQSPTAATAFADTARPHLEPKYLVFLMLLSICLSCFSSNVTVHLKSRGTMLIACIKCLCCRSVREWASQPQIRGTPAGNILLSGSILFSGCLPNKFLRAMRSINIAVISTRTYFRHQSKYLINVVGNVWIAQRNAMFNELQRAELVIGADGRCDSMGHSVKYGSYTAMDLERNKVLNIELVQSNEVKSSTHMELRGLQKMVQLFQEFSSIS